jgi:septal ring factor EnvC (AmiA/AmiB activator)
MQKIESEKNRLNQDKEQIANELVEKEAKLREEQQEKMDLESMLTDLNNKLVSGGQ